MIDRSAALADIVTPAPVALGRAQLDAGYALWVVALGALLLILLLWRAWPLLRALQRLSAMRRALRTCEADAWPGLAAMAQSIISRVGLQPNPLQLEQLRALRYGPEPDRDTLDGLLLDWNGLLWQRLLMLRWRRP